jgi:ferrous iron transport protein A
MDLINIITGMKLTDLKPGEKGIITQFQNDELQIKLMEMGCTPGEIVLVEQQAPMGGPISIKVSGYSLSLRRNEANQVEVDLL